MNIICTGLWHILTGYGYQMISEDQKEAEVVKDSHVVTLVVRARVFNSYHLLLGAWFASE